MTETRNMTIPIENEKYAKYVLYSLPQDEAIAIVNFKQRFGYAPQEVFNWNNRYLFVGPVEDRNE